MNDKLKPAINKYITAVTWCLLHWYKKHAHIADGLKRVGLAEDELRILGVSETAILKLIDLCAEKASQKNLAPLEQEKIEKLLNS